MTELQKRIDRYNLELAQVFGRNEHGQPKFKWAHTADMTCFEEAGLAEVQPAGFTVFGARMDYRPRAWADVVGPCWCVCKWEFKSEAEWSRVYGNSLPWPKHGEYAGIHSTFMPVGMEPDDDIQAVLIYRLKEHLGMKPEEHDAAVHIEVAARSREQERILADRIDNERLPFYHVPGAKDHVSIPSIQPKEMRA